MDLGSFPKKEHPCQQARSTRSTNAMLACRLRDPGAPPCHCPTSLSCLSYLVFQYSAYSRRFLAVFLGLSEVAIYYCIRFGINHTPIARQVGSNLSEAHCLLIDVSTIANVLPVRSLSCSRHSEGTGLLFAKQQRASCLVSLFVCRKSYSRDTTCCWVLLVQPSRAEHKTASTVQDNGPV